MKSETENNKLLNLANKRSVQDIKEVIMSIKFHQLNSEQEKKNDPSKWSKRRSRNMPINV